jgi:glycosyltransferase involved in cell wall biosynthesis
MEKQEHSLIKPIKISKPRRVYVTSTGGIYEEPEVTEITPEVMEDNYYERNPIRGNLKQSEGKPKSISIIVTARNNGQYLYEALYSCIKQTVPCEVIYSDDFSTDDSVEVAKKFGDRIKIVTHDEHVGVVKARNNGFDASTGEAVVFMDGDDILPKNFIEKHLEVFDRTTPYVYCAAKAFGLFEVFWDVHPWGVLDLWNRNFVNTNAMRWRDKFIEAGKWQETTIKTMWDFDLAIRMSRLGKPRKSDAVLLYRQHGDSVSFNKEKSEQKLFGYTNVIRKNIVTVTVGVVYGGRSPKLFDKWMDSLISDIVILENKPELIIYNNSSVNIKQKLKLYEDRFSGIKIIEHPEKIKFSNEIERRNKVCEMLANAYNMIMENSSGDIVHLREDDVITPIGGFSAMFDEMITGIKIKDAVALPYFNRHQNYKRWVGGMFNHQDIRKTSDFKRLPSQDKPFMLDYTGTGCVMFWKHRCPDIFKPYLSGIQAHDWAFWYDHKMRGGELWMLPQYVCKHYHDETRYIQPKNE